MKQPKKIVATRITLDTETQKIAKAYIQQLQQATLELQKIIIITCGAKGLDPKKWALAPTGETLDAINETEAK